MAGAGNEAGERAQPASSAEHTVELRFRRVHRAVAGVARVDGKPPQSFDGWLDLLGLLRTVCAGSYDEST